MCTVVVDIEPGGPALVAGVRDELVDRAWQPPGRYWPDYPELIGGRDLLAGGTWLAVAPGARRVACVLNGRGRMAAARRRSRGVLPLQVAVSGKLGRWELSNFDPFHLLSVEPGMAMLWSWDGQRRTEQELTAGLHMVVNSGLGSDLLASDGPGSGSWGRPARRASTGNQHELARVAHFLPRLRAAARPVPPPAGPVAAAWGAWLPLMNGGGIGREDPRALIVRRDLGGGRIWGTTSISLIALSRNGLRYEFTGTPGDPAAWYPVAVATPT